jgi:heavy metal translocating P-type ATPase
MRPKPAGLWRKLGPFLKDNPVPLIALSGLCAGAIARWGFRRPELGHNLWWATLLLGGAPLTWQTLRGMLRGRFAADVVALLAILTAFVMGEAFAGVIIVLMQSGGEALEKYSLRRASSALDQLLARAPRIARRKTDEHLVEIDVAQVQIGDTLVVRPGDMIPVDGILQSEQAEVDEAALTGEPLTRPKKRGDRLLSGSVNNGDAFDFRAEKLSVESEYAQIVRLVRQAQAEKPPLQRLADRYAVWFTPLTLAMCGLGWLITGEPRTILSVLVVATPCPLILAVPVAVISGINRAARAGIIVKGGTAIEQIGRAQAVIFDKTGTLTHGAPVVGRLVPVGGVSEEDLLRSAGSVEQLSSHLLAQTLSKEAQARLGPLLIPSHFLEVPGRGVEGDVDGRHVLVGSRRFLADRLGSAHPLPAETGGAMAAYVAIDGLPAGVVFFEDHLRSGVPELMRRLREMGVQRTIMLTGDHIANALAIGQEAGIDQIEADLLPQDKVEKLQAIKRQYEPIVMVGDGINDAPALAAATVGVAMGAHGTGISAEAADIVLLVDDVAKLGEAMAIGRRMVRIAKQSIYVGLGLSLAFMVVAALGMIPPVIGALLQEAIDVAVILNALRAR